MSQHERLLNDQTRPRGVCLTYRLKVEQMSVTEFYGSGEVRQLAWRFKTRWKLFQKLLLFSHYVLLLLAVSLHHSFPPSPQDETLPSEPSTPSISLSDLHTLRHHTGPRRSHVCLFDCGLSLSGEADFKAWQEACNALFLLQLAGGDN